MEVHEAADIFPLDEEHLDDLAADIREQGVLVPIETFEGKILDGRRRFRACELAGVEPRFKPVNPADPVAHVLSLNLHRRHLTTSQLAMVGARARELYDRAAKERQHEGQKSGGRGNKKNTVENLPPSSSAETGKARDAVGKVVGVSGKSIDFATRVLKNAEPELVKAVDEGRMAISTAAVHATDEPEKQREVAAFYENGRPRNRKYEAGRNGVRDDDQGDEEPPAPDPDNKPEDRKILGRGVILANEAINCLIRIPKNDALRSRGLRLVMDWIKRNR